MNTIVAVATPPGRSAIGVIRLSGPDSLAVARSLIGEDQFTPEPGHAVLKNLWDLSANEMLDRALLTYFKRPHSYTGEDLVEISCHGSPIILRRIIDLVLGLNARLAGPGEFTLRALSNGKMNLSQAEAIRDLINAQTSAAARQAVRQLSGELAARLRPVKERLLQIVVILESALEFVEDDLPEFRTQEIKQELAEIACEVRGFASTFSIGHLLRDGIKVTIVGRPNVGKSSLFNRLLSLDRAIVTDVPGTTRDSLTEPISFNGIPVLLTDTAGMREPCDRIEGFGVERTHRAIADADLLLAVIDGSTDLSREDVDVLSHASQTHLVVAVNKSDVASFRKPSTEELDGEYVTVEVSALTGRGIDELRAAILEPFGSVESEGRGLLITDSRHHDLLSRTERELEFALRSLDEHASEELVLVGLHNGLRFLGELTGETTPEDILARIFSSFCIGK
jgi:tRNA modification GTPase